MTQYSPIIRLKKALTALICLIGLAVALDRPMAAPSQPVNPPCVPLGGTFVLTLFQFDSPTTAHAEVEVCSEGQLIGLAAAQYFNIEQKGKGVTQMNGLR
jgi:hypothetical protein